MGKDEAREMMIALREKYYHKRSEAATCYLLSYMHTPPDRKSRGIFLILSPYNGTSHFSPIEIRFSEIYNQIRNDEGVIYYVKIKDRKSNLLTMW